LVTLGMVHSYHVIEPKEAKFHAFRRSALSGAMYGLLFSLKAFSILLVGIGFKLVLYRPGADAHSDFAVNQRLTLGVASMVCFSLPLIMHPLHTGFKKYYDRKTLREHPERTACLFLRILLVGAMAGFFPAPLRPYENAMLHAGLAVAAMSLTHLQLYVYGTDVEIEVAGMPTRTGKALWTKLALTNLANVAGGGHNQTGAKFSLVAVAAAAKAANNAAVESSPSGGSSPDPNATDRGSACRV